MLLELSPELVGLLWPSGALLDGMLVCRRLRAVLPLHAPRIALTIKGKFDDLAETFTCSDAIALLRRFRATPLDLRVPSIFIPAERRDAWVSWDAHCTAVLGVTAALRDGLLRGLVALDVGIVCCVRDITAAIRASAGTLESVSLSNNHLRLSELREVSLALQLCSRLRSLELRDQACRRFADFSVAAAAAVAGLLGPCRCLALVDLDLGSFSAHAAAELAAALRQHSGKSAGAELRVSGPSDSEAALLTLMAEAAPALREVEFAEWTAGALDAITAGLPRAPRLQRLVVWCSTGSSALEFAALRSLGAACAARGVALQCEWV